MSKATMELFDRFRNRPQPIDPATGQPVVRTHPFLDAIKAGLAQLAAQGFTTLGPLLLQLAQKYLGTLTTPASTKKDTSLADARAIVEHLSHEQGVSHGASHIASVFPAFDAIYALLKPMFDAVGPAVVAWLISQLETIYGTPKTK